MTKFKIQTENPKQVLDITDKINSFISDSKAEDGVCNIFVMHTTCALATADLDPGTDLDLLDAVEKIFPTGKYRHPHDPTHVGEHIMSTLIGQSITIPFENNKLTLGTWQRVILIELSGPRERELRVNLI